MSNLLYATCSLQFKSPEGIGKIPSVVQILPSGPTINGINGESWLLDSDGINQIIAHFKHRNDNGRPLVFDYEHATELRANKGLPSPASGWGTELTYNNGFWATVNWTDKAKELIANNEYKFLSPVIAYEKESKRIVAITSVGLVNQPNLTMQALNREGKPEMSYEKICKALNIETTNDENTIVIAINTLENDLLDKINKSTNKEPDLSKFVPRADYDNLLAKANNSENMLNEINNSLKQKEIEFLINKALEQKKICPATKGYYIKQCNNENGIKEFKEFIENAPAIIAELNLDSAKENQVKKMNREQFLQLNPVMRRDFAINGGILID